ncbi:hypothetical protein FOCC_FOCC015597, partial [Frankliniella occidentalis]
MVRLVDPIKKRGENSSKQGIPISQTFKKERKNLLGLLAETRLQGACHITIGDQPVVVKEGEHSHAPDQDEIAAKEIINKIKALSVQQPEAPPIQITSNQLQRIPQVSNGVHAEGVPVRGEAFLSHVSVSAVQVVLAKLPNDAAIKRTINCTRQAILPRNPKTLRELPSLNREFTLTFMGDVFLLWDSLDDKKVGHVVIGSNFFGLKEMGEKMVGKVELGVTG